VKVLIVWSSAPAPQAPLRGERKVMDYKMLVGIPIKDVPDDVSIQEAKVTAEIWLKEKIEDAVLLKFE